MKIGVAEIAIAGGLAWLLFGRGGKAAQAVVERPAPAPQPSPAYETPGITPPVIPAPPVPQAVAPEVLPIATAPITRLPGTGFEVSVVPVAYPVERGSTPTIRVTLSNRSDQVATVWTGALVLRTKGNVNRISRPLASGGDLILYPGQTTEIPFSFYVPFWWGGVYDLFVYAADRYRGSLTDDKYSSVLYVSPGEEGPEPEMDDSIGG